MTRRSDMMLEDITGCDHTPETPVVEEDGSEILYWLCQCGRRRYPQEGRAAQGGQVKDRIMHAKLVGTIESFSRVADGGMVLLRLALKGTVSGEGPNDQRDVSTPEERPMEILLRRRFTDDLRTGQKFYIHMTTAEPE